MATVEVKKLTKSFGETKVLKELNLSIQEGEFVVLVGPSGCGKSTTLRLIAGLEEPSTGDIFINRELATRMTPKQRQVAMVFQNYALYPHMDVYENMSFNLVLSKIPKDQIQKRVKEVAEVLGLTSYLKRKPHELSGGQRQRVAMGRAMVRRPQVFLFDEPLSNLDAKLRSTMRSEIKRLHKTSPVTTIYVTHDQVEAMTLADRMVVMNQGHVEQVGTPQELFDKPCNTFVASFLGSPPMNLIKRKDDILGIRPEHIELGEKEDGKAEIVLIETLGDERLIYLSFLEQTIVARHFSKKKFFEGQEVGVHFPSSFQHRFSLNGERL